MQCFQTKTKIITFFLYRILPNGTDNNVNQEGVDYYRRIFEELLKANVTPVVTLFHWDMPTTLMDLGGWNNPKVIDFFEDYARVVFKLFGHLVKMWLTINELHWNCLAVSPGSSNFNTTLIFEN